MDNTTVYTVNANDLPASIAQAIQNLEAKALELTADRDKWVDACKFQVALKLNALETLRQVEAHLPDIVRQLDALREFREGDAPGVVINRLYVSGYKEQARDAQYELDFLHKLQEEIKTVMEARHFNEHTVVVRDAAGEVSAFAVPVDQVQEGASVPATVLPPCAEGRQP